MSLLHIVIMAVIQGLTEFLPISSSAHLILVHAVLGDTDAGLDRVMDIAVHVGTLVAVLVYFRRDIAQMIAAIPALLTGGWKVKGSPAALALLIIIGSIPAIIGGFVIYKILPQWDESLIVIAVNSIVFGILLWLVDRRRPSELGLADLTVKSALLIGTAQALALIPGVSRSGITMTAARSLGFNRTDAVRYSFFLSIVAIVGAGLLGSIELYKAHDAALAKDALIAAVISFAAGWAAIAFLLRWLQKADFTPFVIYRVVLGLALLGLLYTGVL